MKVNYINKKIFRKNFSKHNQISELPNLLDIQKESFNRFITYKNNNKSGIDYVFKSIFPILNYNKNAKLEYINYFIENNNISSDECHYKGITYSLSLKVKLKLIIYEKNSQDKIKNEITQIVYMGEIPNMTENASFIINGVEKVVVSQLHRSPGVFFDKLIDKNNIKYKNIYSARIIPYRGSWIDFEIDYKNRIYSRIDRKKKFPVTVFFHSFNYSNYDIINIFCKKLIIKIIDSNFYLDVINLKNKKLSFDIKIKGILNLNKFNFISEDKIKFLLKNNINIVEIKIDDLINNISAKDYYDNNNNLIISCNSEFNLNNLNKIRNSNIKNIELIDILNNKYERYIIETLKVDSTYDYKSAINEIHKIVRPGEFCSFESSEYLFKSLFFSIYKYDLSEVGRIKINESLNNYDIKSNVLCHMDFIRIIKKLINIKNNNLNVDDIDNLGNRRIKTVGEMIENQFRIGLLRMEKSVKDRLSIGDISNLTPKKIISTKQLSSTIKEFFNSSQLSQFMDQNNPLSEITHKRRISALGPGGLTRERAGFEVRDVHYSHYGKLCPIETPEGPNIGLINSLSIYSTINKYGFLESKYQIVFNGIVTNKIKFLSSSEEFNFIIAQASSKIDDEGKFLENYVMCRYKGEFNLFKSSLVNYIDVSKQQIVSIGTSLIPFLEHNDANRVLMGANMQRQAVSLIKSESPLIGTGMELNISKDSGAAIFSKRGGKVCYLNNNCIIIKVNDEEITNDLNDNGIDIYRLKKFNKSNQNTCINYIPKVNLYEDIKKNEVISDSQFTDNGELSLGKNIKVAFMSWYGYNFEDSMIISERLIKDNIFTSIHIQEFICISRDTKLGKEEITSDIPNISDSYLKKLDESGIIHLGSYVEQGEILVGKVTPKGETQLTPEEKLLKAIFGEKASNVKDSSLRVPNGVYGIVTDVQIFTKEGVKKDKRTLDIESNKIENFKKNLNEEKELTKYILLDKIKFLFKKINIKFNINFIEIYNYKNIIKIFKTNNLYDNIKNLIKKYNNIETIFKNKFDLYKKRIYKFDDLPNDILKIIKVYVATKKSIQTGDKIAGRHGNKGVISKINLIEDMPYDINGEPIDIILNPLGVPSRMNIGQILETHLGLSLKTIGKKIQNIICKLKSVDKLRKYLDKIYNFEVNDLNNKINFNNFNDKEILLISDYLKNGFKISTPVFDGINEKEIKNMLKISNIDDSGQIELFDGFTGEKFDRRITVGYIYIMKLNHLVDDKMHARSTGSYSLITQQPLGGKAQFGGQRFGEMEVWALEAYGAAYTLQEMLTVKSDDVYGRTNMYKNIIYGNYNTKIGIPESFNVLFKEIRSLGINIELDEIE